MVAAPAIEQGGTATHLTAAPSERSSLPWPVAIYLICIVVPISFTLGPMFLTLVRALLLIMVVPLFIRLLLGHFGRILLIDGLFIAHVLWMVVALSVTSPDQVVTQSGSVGIEFIGGYLIGRAYIRDRATFIGMAKFLVILVLLSTPFAIYEARTGRPIIVETIRQIPGLTSVASVTIEKRMGLERVQFTFAHPIHYGLWCSVVFSLCLVALKDIYSLWRRLITATIVMLSGFLALSSGALLAFVLQLMLILWSVIFAGLRWRWWLLIGLFALVYIVIDLLSTRDPLRVFMSYATFSAHNAYWRGIIFEWGLKNVFGDMAENIPPAPWFGIGMNSWVRPSFMHSGSMDNFWLVITVRYGVPAFVFLVLGYALGLFQIMRRNFDADARLLLLRRAWVFTFLGLSFTLSTVFVWTNVYSFVFFIFGAGLWLITAEVGQTPATGTPATEPQSAARTSGPRYTRFPAAGVRTRAAAGSA